MKHPIKFSLLLLGSVCANTTLFPGNSFPCYSQREGKTLQTNRTNDKKHTDNQATQSQECDCQILVAEEIPQETAEEYQQRQIDTYAKLQNEQKKALKELRDTLSDNCTTLSEMLSDNKDSKIDAPQVAATTAGYEGAKTVNKAESNVADVDPDETDSDDVSSDNDETNQATQSQECDCQILVAEEIPQETAEEYQQRQIDTYAKLLSERKKALKEMRDMLDESDSDDVSSDESDAN